MCIGEKTFEWVYKNRKEFVDFTLMEMENPSGLFKKWQLYCQHQKKMEDKKINDRVPE